MTALFSLQSGVHLQASTLLSTHSFSGIILFAHLKALRVSEVRLVRTVGMVRLDEIICEILSKKMALTLRPPTQVYCSPSSTQTSLIIKPVQFRPETT